jgi:hypothetical protein
MVMSTGDHFAPPNLHTAADHDDLRTLIEAQKVMRNPNRHKAALAHRQKLLAATKSDRRLSERDRRATDRNPLYSRALGASGANDGNQGKTQNATGIPQTGNTFSSSYTYPNSGSGNP